MARRTKVTISQAPVNCIVRATCPAYEGQSVSVQCVFYRELHGFRHMVNGIEQSFYNGNGKNTGIIAKAVKRSTAEAVVRGLEQEGYSNITIIEVPESEIIAGVVPAMKYVAF